jgi:hypothetical protein
MDEELGDAAMIELPKRTAAELAIALRERADRLTGEPWEVPATAAMMREAADLLATSSERRVWLLAEMDNIGWDIRDTRLVTWAFMVRQFLTGR